MTRNAAALDVGERPFLSLALMAVCFYLLCAPVWFPPFPVRAYDGARIFELILLVLVVPLTLFPDARAAVLDSWDRLGRPARWAAMLFLLAGVLGVAVSGATHVAAQQVALTLLLLWLFLSACAFVRVFGSAAELSLAIVLTTGAALTALKFWGTFFQDLDDGRPFSWVSPFLDFANVRFFGQYQAYVLLAVTLPAVMLPLTRSWRFLVWLAGVNMWALQWMVGSRAVWAGLLAAIVIVCACMHRGRVRWLGEQGALVLAGGALYLVFSTLVLDTPGATPIPVANSLVERGNESISERVTLARGAGRLIVEHPLAGVGPGQFGLHYADTAAAHPHDTPLQLLVEYGVIGGAAGVALGALLVLYALRELRRRTLHRPDLVLTSLVAAVVMGMVDSLFSGNLIMPHSQVWFCVLAGWIVGRTSPTYPAHVRFRPDAMRTALAAGAVAAAIVVSILAVTYLDAIRDMAYPASLRIPSFWQYGRFAAW